MRETRADTTQALFYALALHALLFVLAFIGLWWTRTNAPVSAAGPVIEAELIDPDALSDAMRRALRDRPEPVAAAAPPPPAPEPVEEAEPVPPPPQAEPQPAPQDVVPEPDTREQERVAREAIAQETREREQEEKRRQEQVDLTQRERQKEAEQRQKLTQMEQERLKQLEDIRRRRAQASREAKLAEDRLKQLAEYNARNAAEAAAQADAAASRPPGNRGADANLLARYQAAIMQAIRPNWTRPESVPLGQVCVIHIRQIPGGEVIDVEVSTSCPYDEAARRSVERAVLMAQPLPYAGYESVFRRELILKFRAEDSDKPGSVQF